MEDKKSQSAFFLKRRSFHDTLINYHRMNADGKLDEYILNTIQNYAKEDLLNLLELSSEDYPVIHHYCYAEKPLFTHFWDNLLSSGEAFKRLNIAIEEEILPSPHIHSLDIIKSYYRRAFEEKTLSTKSFG